MGFGVEISLPWGGEDRNFALKAKEIEGLEGELNEGIGKICGRVFSRLDFSYKHVRQTIYWGLIGGGATVTDATKLVRQYVDGCPIDGNGDPNSNLSTAYAILKVVYFGWEDLPPLGEAGAGATRPTEQTSDSTEPFSSEQG